MYILCNTYSILASDISHADGPNINIAFFPFFSKTALVVTAKAASHGMTIVVCVGSKNVTYYISDMIADLDS